jgi:hypothetical protein
MLTQAQMEENGTRIREALEVLGMRWPENPVPLDFLYLYALVSNFLVLLEEDHGVMPGAFGSHGFLVHVINPASGAVEEVQRSGFQSMGAAALKPVTGPPPQPQPAPLE